MGQRRRRRGRGDRQRRAGRRACGRRQRPLSRRSGAVRRMCQTRRWQRLSVLFVVVVDVVSQAVMGDVLWRVGRLKWIEAKAQIRVCQCLSSMGYVDNDVIVN